MRGASSDTSEKRTMNGISNNYRVTPTFPGQNSLDSKRTSADIRRVSRDIGRISREIGQISGSIGQIAGFIGRVSSVLDTNKVILDLYLVIFDGYNSVFVQFPEISVQYRDKFDRFHVLIGRNNLMHVSLLDDRRHYRVEYRKILSTERPRGPLRGSFVLNMTANRSVSFAVGRFEITSWDKKSRPSEAIRIAKHTTGNSRKIDQILSLDDQNSVDA